MKETKAASEPVKQPNEIRVVTTSTTVKLNEFVLDRVKYCHRDDSELDDATKLQPLAGSIAAEGLQNPIEFYRDAKGRPVVLKGHRRVSACRQNAKKGIPGFTEEMEIPAIEVKGASPQDHVVRSVLDNINRQSFSHLERIRVTKTLDENGVDAERAATALGISLMTFQRDLRVAQHPWLVDLIGGNCIASTTAHDLIVVAMKQGSVDIFQTHLLKWVENTIKFIDDQVKNGKKLSTARQLVKNHLTKSLADHWIVQLGKKEPLDDNVPSPARVAIDAESNRVTINVADLDLMKVPLRELAKVVGDLESAKCVALRYLKTRHAVETLEGPQELARSEAGRSSGLALLREEGLDDLLDLLENATPNSGTVTEAGAGADESETD